MNLKKKLASVSMAVLFAMQMAVMPIAAQAPEAIYVPEDERLVQMEDGNYALQTEDGLMRLPVLMNGDDQDDPQAPRRNSSEVSEAAKAMAAMMEDENGEPILMTPEQAEALLAAAKEEGLDETNGLFDGIRNLFARLFGKKKTGKSGWVRERGGKEYYYSPETNEPVKGIQVIDDKLYYFDTNGLRQDVTFGVDVSHYQPEIDWKKMRASGVEFVILRMGYRGYGAGGQLKMDGAFESHLKGARSVGLRVGGYFFTQAINEAEAIEEAFGCVYVLKTGYGFVKPGDFKFPIELDYPVYYDTEGSGNYPNGRADKISNAMRTACTIAFCEEIRMGGYNPGVYASTNWYKTKLDMSNIEGRGYSIWNAHYGVQESPLSCDIWQGSCKGVLSGVKNADVDVNISYMG